MAGCIQGIKRMNFAHYGDIEGPMTNLKSGSLAITIENEQVIAWIVNAPDVILSKENVASVVLTTSGITVTNLSSGGGKPFTVNVYKIEMKNGQVGVLRLKVNTADRVLNLLV